jgi:hypothetical protein
MQRSRRISSRGAWKAYRGKIIQTCVQATRDGKWQPVVSIMTPGRTELSQTVLDEEYDSKAEAKARSVEAAKTMIDRSECVESTSGQMLDGREVRFEGGEQGG